MGVILIKRDLCVGNIIEYAGVHGRVTGIREDGYLESDLVEAPITTFKPVTLTKDWLIDFGFRKDGDNYRIGTNWFYLMQDCEGLKGFYFRSLDGYVLEVKYVHQLQNLYTIFYNQELKKIEISNERENLPF